MGALIMPTSRQIDFDKTYSSNNYGNFKIVKEVFHEKSQKRRVLIEFSNTGSISEVSYDEALRGCVKDKFMPSIFGIGFLGNAHKKGNEREYNIWIDMLSRCYNEQDKAYRFYGQVGCKVSDEWHCFENFLADIKEIPGYSLLKSNNKCELDKDFLQCGVSKKIYSKETCVWKTKDENNRIHLIDLNRKRNYSSKYIGVCFDRRYKSFQSQINIGGKQIYIGKFSNEISAANAYNYYAKQQGIELTLNDCPYMSVEEWTKYKRKRGKNK